MNHCRLTSRAVGHSTYEEEEEEREDKNLGFADFIYYL